MKDKILKELRVSVRSIGLRPFGDKINPLDP